MRLTRWTDYTLRVLMYCAASEGRDTPVTIAEIAQAHNISRSHLTKIVMELSAQGLLETTRGRGGGLRLLKPASETRSAP
jgi:Rrf2 family nitric oxide-sensitive transcriptional repressor